MLIDTHAHLDGEEFRDDLDDVMARAAAAGVEKVLLPAIDLASAESVVAVCKRFPGRAYPMIGLHPEEVKADWQAVLAKMHELLLARRAADEHPWIAIGEVGLDYYWSREFADEQLLAFEKGMTGNDDAPDADEGAIYLLQKSSRLQAFQPRLGKRPTGKNRW